MLLINKITYTQFKYMIKEKMNSRKNEFSILNLINIYN